jgi:hypothetical protein
MRPVARVVRAGGHVAERRDHFLLADNAGVGELRIVSLAARILEPSARLCKPDLHVFAKLFEDRLKRGLKAQAFSRREIGGHEMSWISSSDTLSMSV